MSFRKYFSNKLLYILLLTFVLPLGHASCKGKKEEAEDKTKTEAPKYPRFVTYESFKDKHDLHMAVAATKGVGPLQNRNDTLKYADKLQKLPEELDIFKLDNLTHSIPYLIDDAASLLVQIGFNFRDSLRRKELPPYKLVVTSIMRTREDVNKLTKRNINAIDNSVHCYGTTFDISWKRFQKIGPKGEDDVPTERLKYILGQVLHDLRVREKCYVVHEKKQACFHITVR